MKQPEAFFRMRREQALISLRVKRRTADLCTYKRRGGKGNGRAAVRRRCRSGYRRSCNGSSRNRGNAGFRNSKSEHSRFCSASDTARYRRSKAQAILAYREEKGGFSGTEELMNVPGIKESTFSKIKDKIAVE